MREGFPLALLEYERQRQAMQRYGIEKSYVTYRRKWETALEEFNRGLKKNISGAMPVEAQSFAESAELDHRKSQMQPPFNTKLPGLAALLKALNIKKGPPQ
jgi:hypothetical protein